MLKLKAYLHIILSLWIRVSFCFLYTKGIARKPNVGHPHGTVVMVLVRLTLVEGEAEALGGPDGREPLLGAGLPVKLALAQHGAHLTQAAAA